MCLISVQPRRLESPEPSSRLMRFGVSPFQYEEGETATPGIKNMAETGEKARLASE